MDSRTLPRLPKTPTTGPSIRRGDEKSNGLGTSNPSAYGPYPTGHMLVCIFNVEIHSTLREGLYPHVPLILVRYSPSFSTIYVNDRMGKKGRGEC